MTEEVKPDSFLIVPSMKDLKRFGAGIITYVSIVVGGIVGLGGAVYLAGWFLTKLFGGA